jgi:hypothetical protein
VRERACGLQAVKEYAKDWSHALSGSMRRLILAEYGKPGGTDTKTPKPKGDAAVRASAPADSAELELNEKREADEREPEQDDAEAELEDDDEGEEAETVASEAKQAALQRKLKKLPKEVREKEAVESRLHDKRHGFILRWLKSMYNPKDAPYIVGTRSLAHTLVPHARTHTHTAQHRTHVRTWLVSDARARADLDYGCAQGQLSEKLHQTLPKAAVVSCDANATVFGWRVFRKNRAIQTVLCNLLYPPIGT